MKQYTLYICTHCCCPTAHIHKSDWYIRISVILYKYATLQQLQQRQRHWDYSEENIFSFFYSVPLPRWFELAINQHVMRPFRIPSGGWGWLTDWRTRAYNEYTGYRNGAPKCIYIYIYIYAVSNVISHVN